MPTVKQLEQIGMDAIKMVRRNDRPDCVGDLKLGDWLHAEYLHEDGRGGAVYHVRVAGVLMQVLVNKNGYVEPWSP